MANALIAWQGTLTQAGLPALIRVPLVHLYIELIHPFGVGNGRGGRVIEATIPLAVGYCHAPFASTRHHLANIDGYCTLFNNCRKAAEKG